MNVKFVFVFLFLLCGALGKGPSKYQTVEDLQNEKAFKKILKSKNNILVLFASNLKDNQNIVKLFRESSNEIKGLVRNFKMYSRWS